MCEQVNDEPDMAEGDLGTLKAFLASFCLCFMLSMEGSGLIEAVSWRSTNDIWLLNSEQAAWFSFVLA